MTTFKRFLFFMYFVMFIIKLECKLISRRLESISQDCDQRTFDVQRVDVFAGDSVDLVCGCHRSHSYAGNQQGVKLSSGAVTDKSNFVDLTAWTFSRQLSPFKESYFALNRNKASLYASNDFVWSTKLCKMLQKFCIYWNDF